MTIITSSFNRDANYVPITTLGLQATKGITYVAGTTGAVGTTTLFTVTGTVAVNVFAVCTTDLAGATATISIGTATSTASLCASTTATTIDNHFVWYKSVNAVGGVVGQSFTAVNENIIQTIGTAAISGGVLDIYCLWTPLSSDGNVVAA